MLSSLKRCFTSVFFIVKLDDVNDINSHEHREEENWCIMVSCAKFKFVQTACGAIAAVFHKVLSVTYKLLN